MSGNDISTNKAGGSRAAEGATGKNAPSDSLLTPVQFIKGIGPVKAELLAKLDLHYARDLVFNFPRAYQDMSELRTIEQLEEGKLASVAGVVEEVDLRNTGTGRSLLGVLIKQGASYLRALWFNQPYLRSKFQTGRRILLSGEPKMQGIRWEMVHPKYEFLADHGGRRRRLVPVAGDPRRGDDHLFNLGGAGHGLLRDGGASEHRHSGACQKQQLVGRLVSASERPARNFGDLVHAFVSPRYGHVRLAARIGQAT